MKQSTISSLKIGKRWKKGYIPLVDVVIEFLLLFGYAAQLRHCVVLSSGVFLSSWPIGKTTMKELYSARSQIAHFWQCILERNEEDEKKMRGSGLQGRRAHFLSLTKLKPKRCVKKRNL